MSADRRPCARRISVAILAIGGQGGGVLCDWLVDLAEHEGWLIQTTSVPGVAQRTGATLYYAELFHDPTHDEAEPVLALMPSSGDVDVVVAAELMEAGRAMQRGLVTPGRTTLIASSHRSYAIAEKSALGDGRASSQPVYDAARAAARRFICFDMAQIAESHGAVISASLFGALAGAAVLPFSRAAFEGAIERRGVGVDASRRAFAEACERAASCGPSLPRATDAAQAPAAGLRVSEAPVSASFESLSNLPGPVRSIASEGVRRLIDYQDAGYAQRYLDIVQGMAGLDEKFAGQTQRWDLTIALARHLALCMAYEDTIRIADLKTRRSRFERLRGELRARPGQLLHFTEFMHPRVEEVADSLPPALGRRLLRNRFLRGILTRACSGGLRLRTTSLRGFLPLWLLGRLRGYRRRTLRFVREMAQIDAWLAHVERVVEKDYALACEMIECAQVLKGYGETAERGRRNFDALLEAADRLLGRDDAARGLRRLREAALQDEDGGAFAAARGMLAL